MKRLIVLLGLVAMVAGCARYKHTTADGDKISIILFATDPKLKGFMLQKADGTRLEMKEAEYTSEPGVRMLEMALDKLESAYLMKSAAGGGPILPP